MKPRPINALDFKLFIHNDGMWLKRRHILARVLSGAQLDLIRK